VGFNRALGSERMETWPAARLDDGRGNKERGILRGPPSTVPCVSRSIMSESAMPEPIVVRPRARHFSGVIFRPDILNASSAAARARWMKRAHFSFDFFFFR